MGGRILDQDKDKSSNKHEGQVKGLAHFVASEARVSDFVTRIRPNPELITQGWQRRFVSDARRTPEMVSMYEELGFEVHLEQVRATEFSDECEDCRMLALLNFTTIYTRKSAERDDWKSEKRLK